jgi:hypothetical protein
MILRPIRCLVRLLGRALDPVDLGAGLTAGPRPGERLTRPVRERLGVGQLAAGRLAGGGRRVGLRVVGCGHALTRPTRYGAGLSSDWS